MTLKVHSQIFTTILHFKPTSVCFSDQLKHQGLHQKCQSYSYFPDTNNVGYIWRSPPQPFFQANILSHQITLKVCFQIATNIPHFKPTSVYFSNQLKYQGLHQKCQIYSHFPEISTERGIRLGGDLQLGVCQRKRNKERQIRARHPPLRLPPFFLSFFISFFLSLFSFSSELRILEIASFDWWRAPNLGDYLLSFFSFGGKLQISEIASSTLVVSPLQWRARNLGDCLLYINGDSSLVASSESRRLPLLQWRAPNLEGRHPRKSLI